MSTEVTFELYSGHLPTVPVTVDDRRRARFLIDTGIGVTVVDRALLDELGHPPSGRAHAGRRMSGQEIVLPLSTVDAIALATHRQELPTVGSFDLGRLAGPGSDLGGILSLGFFEPGAVSIDYAHRTIVLEDADGLARRARMGGEVPVEVVRRGPELELFLPLRLPSGRTIRAEIDTGSDQLILNDRFMAELGVVPGAAGVETHEGSDETGHPYVRHRARVRGTFAPVGCPAYAQREPEVLFQKIIFDGLVGRDFLRRAPVTFDVANARAVFGRIP